MSGISAGAKADALDGISIAFATLHDGFPGATGDNELTGGGYVKQAVVFSSTSAGQRLLSGTETWTVPACTVRWIGFQDSTSAYQFCAPNGGATPRNFMSGPDDNLIYATGHAYVNTDKIVFYGGTPPAPLVEGTVYFVRDSTANTFKVATTAGGVAIDLTSAPSFNCVVCKITEQVYPTADTHSLTSATISIPD